MKNSKKVVISTLILFAAVVGLVLFLNREDETGQKTDQTMSSKGHPPIEGQPTLGDAGAPVSIVEFGDYKCPSCKQWGETVYPKLIEDYVDTGKAKFSYINVLFHGEESIIASLASESVYNQDPENFWTFHKAVFDAQPATQEQDNAWVTVDKMKEIAAETAPNVDLAQLEADLNTEGTSVAEDVSKDDGLVQEFNVPFTPTIIIDGVMLEDPFDYEKIESLIEEGSRNDE
ncbi:DsbA family protein [Domibacillus epiphyticus]|uniref:Dihydroneopterin aldolase n=1 Tax=Domibacillus epiphyticus TaxID=1714355 RepID=A0A1V2A492_9BACI|nr:DsbA family protein [Domibacillus epiphyticus]OMP65634.1 dihydroneopterin aldolase [Domibacillus epiphyticus]